MKLKLEIGRVACIVLCLSWSCLDILLSSDSLSIVQTYMIPRLDLILFSEHNVFIYTCCLRLSCV